MSARLEANPAVDAAGVFSEDEYRLDTKCVIDHAIRTGRAVVVRADGSVRVVISIPAAEPSQ